MSQDKIEAIIKWVIHNSILDNNRNHEDKILFQALQAIDKAYKEWFRGVVGEDRTWRSKEMSADPDEDCFYTKGYNEAKAEISKRLK